VIAVKSDVGMMGGKMAHEFMYITPVGEDTLLLCDRCGYAANRQIARFKKLSNPVEDPLPTEKVATPDAKTIEDLAQFLKIPNSKTAKAVFLVATIAKGEQSEDQFVFAVVRGDMELNETKLANALKAKSLRPALEDEIIAVGAVPGYASPVDLEGALVVVDDAIPDSPNLVAGANEDGFHLRNVNYGRDYQADLVMDISAAQEGDTCPDCDGIMRAKRGVEVGNIFKLGPRYSKQLGAFFLDAEGESKPVIMGSYGIGSGRLLACVAEEYHDDNGLIWPISVAPYHVHLVLLSGREDTETIEISEKLYKILQEEGIEVLYDDRNESPGVKFNDADLIGLPIRLTVSQRAMQAGGVEFKRRDLSEKEVIPIEGLVERIRDEINQLLSMIDNMVVKVEFPEDN
jgi:prolyl-tRNA synthetase